MKILVTGSAGFIGMHVAKKLCSDSRYQVLGIDNFNDYYDVRLKRDRSLSLESLKNFEIKEIDINDKEKLFSEFRAFSPDYVIHLAAQAGVRYSLKNPYAYIESNISGFTNILEASKSAHVKHLVYASSSSVYGGNINYPFTESSSVDHPVSLYAATKKSNELMAHVYSHLFGIPTTGLRFFTVYGPWGRPDMALFLFTDAIFNNQPIKIFNHGKMIRDFTYVDDITEALIKVTLKAPEPSKEKTPAPGNSWAPYKIFNIGNSSPIELEEYINVLENKIGKKAKKEFLDIQPGDVTKTHSNTEKLEEWINYKPTTSIETGISNFVDWYKNYYKKK